MNGIPMNGQPSGPNQPNNFGFNQAQQTSLTPEQYVRQKLNSGELTQEQFQQARNFANQVTGMNR